MYLGVGCNYVSHFYIFCMRGIEVCADCTADIFNPSDNLSHFDSQKCFISHYINSAGRIGDNIFFTTK